jgi:hypothetical protein
VSPLEVEDGRWWFGRGCENEPRLEARSKVQRDIRKQRIHIYKRYGALVVGVCSSIAMLNLRCLPKLIKFLRRLAYNRWRPSQENLGTRRGFSIMVGENRTAKSAKKESLWHHLWRIIYDGGKVKLNPDAQKDLFHAEFFAFLVVRGLTNAKLKTTDAGP